MTVRILAVELNRVEGDVEIKLRLEHGVVVDAWCVASTFRGFEQILVGRTPEDALVITPRICGICSTAQLYAATTALEVAGGCAIAPDATRVRNLCLMAEAVMNDARHTFLMFVPDFCNPAYVAHPLHAAALEAFEPPFKGRLARGTVQQTKKMLGVVIAFAGQWPHATHMLPGGVTCPVSRDRLLACAEIVDGYAAWYEREVLGCAAERWLAVRDLAGLEAWLDEDPAHAAGALGLFVRLGRSLGLQRIGRGADELLSVGCYFDPESWQPPFAARATLSPGGVHDHRTGVTAGFDERMITEDVSHAWYEGETPLPPSRGTTAPRFGRVPGAYTWAKAPRYGGRVVEVGPLADLVVAGDPLLTALVRAEGTSAWLRQLARLHRAVLVLGQMRRTLAELLSRPSWDTHAPAAKLTDGDGVGLINAARGPLGHWVSVRDGKIDRYQIVTPTTWNASPRDGAGQRGHWEQSFIGLAIKDVDNPVEVGHVVRSHDPCLVCTVHVVGTGQRALFRSW